MDPELRPGGFLSLHLPGMYIREWSETEDKFDLFPSLNSEYTKSLKVVLQGTQSE